MESAMTDAEKSQLDAFKEAPRELEPDDDLDRFKERVGKLMKHKPVERPE
jgi:plasmid replication initiation protein